MRAPKSWPLIVVKFAQNTTLVLKCCWWVEENRTPLLEGALLLESNWQKNKCSTCKHFNFVAARVQILHKKIPLLLVPSNSNTLLEFISYERLEMKPSRLARGA